MAGRASVRVAALGLGVYNRSMIKKWMIDAVDASGKAVTLYAVTNPARIEEDLKAGPSSSFVLLGRAFNHRENPTEESDHFDMATEAFAHYAKIKNLSLLTVSLRTLLSEIPKDLPGVWMGGAPGVGSYVMEILEQREP